jgi:hypothetical protein
MQYTGVYQIALVNTAVTGAITLVQIKAGTVGAVELLRAWCSQSNSTTSTMQRITILRKSTAATVTSGTPLLINGSQAAKAVGGTSATGTNASNENSGDGDVLYPDVFNILNGWLWVPTPEERIIVPPSGMIGLKFMTAPASSLTINAGFVFGEIG